MYHVVCTYCFIYNIKFNWILYWYHFFISMSRSYLSLLTNLRWGFVWTIFHHAILHIIYIIHIICAISVQNALTALLFVMFCWKFPMAMLLNNLLYIRRTTLLSNHFTFSVCRTHCSFFCWNNHMQCNQTILLGIRLAI